MGIEVIKIGGADGNPIEPLCADLATAFTEGRSVVLVHGGSGETERLAAALGVEQEELRSPSGHVSRRTDRTTLEIFAQATALVNRVRDQWTGRPVGSDPTVLRALLQTGTMPVVAPLAAGESGEMLNVDGDRAAACIAVALGARRLTILSNVPGLLREFPDPTSLIEELDVEATEDFPPEQLGRMAKKLMAAREAIAGGVAEVVLGDARRNHPWMDARAGVGTTIRATTGVAR